MSLDADQLRRQAEQARRPRPTGVAAAMTEVHRHPTVREDVTLESVALPPVPHQALSGLQLLTLLAVPAEQGAGTSRLRPAWGLIRWEWPQLQPLPVERLAPTEVPESGWDLPDRAAAVEPTRTLLEELDRVLAGPWPPDGDTLAQLRELYQPVLPAGAIDVLTRLAPDTRDWLGER